MDHYLYIKDLPLKIKIVYYTSLNSIIKKNCDPIPFLISQFSDIESLLKERKLTKILYFNAHKVHMLLYDLDEIIKLNDSMDNDLCFNYYLFLLIREGEEIINYEFSFNYIKLFYKKIKIKQNKYYNFISYKIIIELINNYINCSLSDENDDDDLVSKLDKESREYIKNEINIFLDIKLNLTEINIIEKNLDELYADIVIAMIINNKLSDFNYCTNIFEQLDLENIDIQFFSSEKLWNLILETLNSENDFIKINDIKDFDDFNDMNKVNFYYFLFKYILKSSFYIYHIPFLFKMHKKVIEILKFQEYITFTVSNQILIERIEYIIKRLSDLDYFYITFYLNKKKSIKSGAITIISNILKNSQCIFDISVNLKQNPEIKSIQCIYGPNKSISLEEMKKLQENNAEYGYSINLNFNLFLNCLYTMKMIIENQINNFQFEYTFKLFFVFKKKIINNNKNDIYNIDVDYSVKEHPFYKIDLKSSDENILIKNYQEFKGLFSLLNKLNFQNNNQISETVHSVTIDWGTNFSFASSFVEIDDYKIIQMEKIIFKHEESVKFFLVLKNGYFFSCGNSGTMVLFNQDFEQLLKKQNLDDNLFYISEINSEGKNIELIACYGKYVYIIIINKSNLEFEARKYEIPNMTILYGVKLKKNNEYALAGIDSAMKIFDIFNDDVVEKKIYKLLNFSSKTGLVINYKYLVLISNELIPKGSNKLVICNLIRNKVEYIIPDYSFNLSENSLCFINLGIARNILLCAIKKYKSSQKNGILVVDMNLVSGENLNHKFFNTGNFEPYCFSQIFESMYVMVGGFSLDKRIGMIRLYKINKNNYELIYLQDIEIIEDDENFNRFVMPINNIIQIKDSGKIIITCIDGGIFLFGKPNLDWYNYNQKE